MAKSTNMTVGMQTQAVKAARSEGKSLDEIEKDYPALKDGVAAVRAEVAAPPKRRGSGSVKAEAAVIRGSVF